MGLRAGLRGYDLRPKYDSGLIWTQDGACGTKGGVWDSGRSRVGQVWFGAIRLNMAYGTKTVVWAQVWRV